MNNSAKSSGEKRPLTPTKPQPHPTHRILVADDEESIRELYAKLLRRRGYLVDSVEDGHEAWKALQTFSYDLLITDNQMPKVSGVELVQKIRSANMNLPVVLASGAVPIHTESLHLAAILPKPFAPEDLVQTVKEILQGSPLPAAAAPDLKKFARRLLDFESAGKSSGEKNSAAFRVSEKMREPLGKLMGVKGYCALMIRAVKLSGTDNPPLRSLQVEADGSLKGWDELAAQPDPRALADSEVALVSGLIALLVTFIGSALTLELLRDIWPEKKNLNFE